MSYQPKKPTLLSAGIAWNPESQASCLAAVEAGDFVRLGHLVSALTSACGLVAQLLRTLVAPAAWAPVGGPEPLMSAAHDVALDAFREETPTGEIPAVESLTRWAMTLVLTGRAVCWRGWRVVGGRLRPHVVLWDTEFTREWLPSERKLQVRVGEGVGAWVDVEADPDHWWVVQIAPCRPALAGLWRSLAWMPYRQSVVAHYGSESARTASGIRYHLHDERPAGDDDRQAAADAVADLEVGDALVTVAGQTLDALDASSAGADVLAWGQRHMDEQAQLAILGRVLTGTEAAGLGQGDARAQALAAIKAETLTRWAQVFSEALYGRRGLVSDWYRLHFGADWSPVQIDTSQSRQPDQPRDVLERLGQVMQIWASSQGQLDLKELLQLARVDIPVKGVAGV